MLSRNFKPGFRLELHIKDLTNALNAAHSIDSPVPLTSQIMEMMQALKVDGCEKEDHSALAKYFEKMSGIVIE
jgi:2-hydroxy-3-oxopropionate reductase